LCAYPHRSHVSLPRASTQGRGQQAHIHSLVRHELGHNEVPKLGGGRGVERGVGVQVTREGCMASTPKGCKRVKGLGTSTDRPHATYIPHRHSRRHTHHHHHRTHAPHTRTQHPHPHKHHTHTTHHLVHLSHTPHQTATPTHTHTHTHHTPHKHATDLGARSLGQISRSAGHVPSPGRRRLTRGMLVHTKQQANRQGPKACQCGQLLNDIRGWGRGGDAEIPP
jgi:hypothetical protein